MVIGWVIVDSLVRGANPLVIPIIISAGAVGLVVGLFIIRLVRAKVRGSNDEETG
jgi:hypothetical protein